MHVCFFTKPNTAIFIFCFIVIAYVLPSVFTLPLTLLFFCNLKKPNWRNKMLVTLLLVHSWVPTMWHKFSMTGSFFLLFFFLFLFFILPEICLETRMDIKAAQLSENA